MLTCVVMQMNEVLKLDNLSCRKKRIDGTTVGVTITLSAGEYKTIGSESSFGTLDLIPAITGEIEVVSGSGTLLGYPLQRMSAWRRRQLLQQIGILSRIEPALSNTTLNEFLALPLRIAGVSPGHINSRIRNILIDMELMLHMHQQLLALSPSQLRMATLAQALIKSPRLILAEMRTDEFDSQVTAPILQKHASHGAAVLAMFDCIPTSRTARQVDYRENEINVAL